MLSSVHHFASPLDLPYARQAPASPMPSSHYQYELAGILVHKGTVDSGHYYSYIKERTPHDPLKPARWYLFNDAIVDVFDERVR